MSRDRELQTSVVAPEGVGRSEAKRIRKKVAKQSITPAPLKVVDDVLRVWGIATRWGKMGQMWGPVAPKLPAHEISTARVGVATPFLAASALNLGGPVIGLSAPSGEPMRFDPWAAYDAGLVSSPGVLIAGAMGAGKSMCAKVLAWWLMGFGRQVIVQSDPKGEWAKIARAVGGTVIQLGLGTTINPLEGGVRPRGVSDEAWATQLADRRGNMLRAIISVLRDGAGFSDHENIILDELVDALGEVEQALTIKDLVQVLTDPPARFTDLAPAEVSVLLGTILRRCTVGPLRGLFDSHSTVKLDPASPMVVFDTSVLASASPAIRQIASACIGSWVDSVLRSMDGRFRIVISEEGWSEMGNPYLVAGMDERLRMAGHWRVSNWLIIHELSDSDQFGAEGSTLRAQIKGIISKSAIKIIYRQSAQEMANLRKMVSLTPDEIDLIPKLVQGVGLWRIGEAASVMVQPLTTPFTYELFNTDSGRSGHYNPKAEPQTDNQPRLIEGSDVVAIQGGAS